MRLFQSERRLSKELTKIFTADQGERLKLAEERVRAEEHDFIVYLPTDLVIDTNSINHLKIRDGHEVVLQY
jgi:hypothetical protein